MNDFYSPVPDNSNVSDERINASFQTLSDINQAFSTTDQNLIPEKILVLMRQTNLQPNTKFLDIALMQCLAIPDVSIQIRTLSAISTLSFLDETSISLLSGFLCPLLSNSELAPYALRCIISVMNPEMFKRLSQTIRRLSIEGSAIVRRLCLVVFYRAYSMDKNNSEVLMEHIRRALFDPEIKENAFTIACEVADRTPELIEPIITLLLPELHDSNFISFTKLLHIFSFFTEDKAFASQLEGELMHFIANNKNVKYTIVVARLLVKMNSPALLQEVKKRFDRILPLIKDQNYVLEISDILVQLDSRLTLCDSTMHSLLTSPNLNVVSAVMKLKGCSPVSDDIVKIVNDIVVKISISPMPHLVSAAMRLIPHHGEWFVTIIFEICKVQNEAVLDQLADTLMDVTDIPTQKHIIEEARKMNELPNDRFGISIAEMIARVSDDVNDFYVLLPSTITRKSSLFQTAMIGCIFEFWNRLNFEFDELMMNRLILISYSSNREVRQRTIELIDLIKSQ